MIQLPEEIDLSSISIEYLRKMILQVGKLTENQYIGGYESEDKLELANLYVLNFKKSHVYVSKRRNIGWISDDETALFRYIILQNNKVWRKKHMRKKEEVVVTQKEYLEDQIKRIEDKINAIFEKVESIEIAFSELMSAEDDDDDEEGVEQ